MKSDPIPRPPGFVAMSLAIAAAVLVALPAGSPTRAANGPDSLAISDIGEKIDARRFEEAEASARDLLARYPEAPDADLVKMLNAIVYAMIQTDRAAEEECGEIARRSLAVGEAMHGEDSAEIVSELMNLSEHLRARQELREARSLLERALRIREKALGADDLKTAKVVGLLAGLHSEAGDYAEAGAMFERQLRSVETVQGADSPDLVPVLYGYARFAGRTADYEKAAALYGRALELVRRDQGDDHPFVAYLLNGLAIVHDEANEYDEARDAYESAIRIAEKTMGENSPFVASCLNNLGYLLKSLGDLDEARRLYERALRVHRENLGERHGYVASTLWNLGEIDRVAGDLDGALRLHEQSLAIREEVLGEDHPETATSLWTIGGILIDRGDPQTALPLLERALRIRREALGGDHHHTAEALQGVARAELWRGDAARAARLYTDAREVIERALGPENPRHAPILLGLARARLRLGERDAALAAALGAEDVSREHARLTAATLPERQALRLAATRTAGLDLALSLASEANERAVVRQTWSSLIRSRALVLDELTRRRTALRERRDEETEQLARELRVAAERYAEMLVRGPGDESDYRAAVEQARRRKEAAERALAKRSGEFRRARERGGIDLAHVESVLAELPTSTLVAYARYRHEGATTRPEDAATDRYVAFVLKAESEPAIVPLGDAAEVDAAIAAWERAVTGTGSDPAAALAEYRAAGERVRRAAWDPVSAHLEGAKQVFVVPDARLHRVSLATLPTDGGGYLVEEEVRFHYLSAERDLALLAEPDTPSGTGMLVVGGVDFDVDGAASGDALPGVRFEPLPASVEEGREVAGLWNQRPQNGEEASAPAVLLTGSSATEAAVKERCGDNRIVHLATHAFVLGTETAGRTGARGIGTLNPARPARARENPLRLAGIVLAGANGHRSGEGEDGILTPEEIAALDLSGSEWVVLSACDTGLGEVQAGEGVLGLRRAFESAGARTLVMSLWPVEDEPARRWMTSLYTARLRDGLETAECVHRASLEALAFARREEGNDHPARWGAFVAAGGWR